MIPDKLENGDEIRVIAPAMSRKILYQRQVKIANQRFEELNFKVTFSTNADRKDEFNSSSISQRLADLHEAFLDKNVKAILTAHGGFNSNQLLKYVDFGIIRKNPKILCGYSDITALQNAIWAKTGLVTYSGPHYSNFGMKKGSEYTLEYFKRCLMENEPYKVIASKEWSDDEWFIEQEKRRFIKNTGFDIIQSGHAAGTILGGNLCTLNLLQGTEFMPPFKDTILFIEDDGYAFPEIFDRDLQSLIHQKNFSEVKAIVIGRFQKKSKMTSSLLNKIISTKKDLQNIPIISRVDFGHTTPMMTFPIGGKTRLVAKNKVKLEIIEH